MSWRDKWVQVLGQTVSTDTDKDNLATFPDMTTPVTLTVSWSQEEYTRILSALLVGSEFTEPTMSMQIFYDFLKLTEGGLPVTCEEIADCIESEIAEGNTTLINSLTQTAISNGTGGNFNHVNGDLTTVLDRNPPLTLQEPINPEFECDLDKLWAGIRHGIVERLDDTARDLLEDLAAINDLPQRFQAFIDVIPVLGDIAEGIVTLATETIPDILNLYNSYSSEAALDEIACNLFSLTCADCAYPTHEQLYNYYSTLGYELDAMDAQTLAPMMQKIAGMIGTFQPASIVYHSMITFQLFVLYLQAEWNGNAGSGAILKFAHLGEDFANNNWLELCEACDEQYSVWEWDFTTQGIGEFYPDTTQNTSKAIFVPGEGWRAVNHSTGRRMDVAFKHDPAWKIEAVAYDVADGASATGHNWIRRPTWGVTTGQQASSAGQADCSGFSYGYDGYLSLTGINEIVFFAQGAAGWQGILRKVRIIYNTGFAPSTGIPTTDNTVC